MATSQIYYPNAAAISHVTPTVFSALRNPQQNWNLEEFAEIPSGDVGPTFVGSHQGTPEFRFGSPEIKKVLDELTGSTSTHYGVAADLSSVNVDIEYRIGTDKGTRDAVGNATHLRGRMESNAMIAWERLSAEQGQLAEADVRFLPCFDGTNDPIQVTDGAAISSGSLGDLFTLGPVKINGSQVAGVTRMVWDNQLQYVEEAADGSSWADFVGIETLQPIVTLRLRDVGQTDDWLAPGQALTALVVYLRKKASAGGNVAAATAEHISLTGADGRVVARQVQDRELEIAIQLTKSGGQWFTISTATAIT